MEYGVHWLSCIVDMPKSGKLGSFIIGAQPCRRICCGGTTNRYAELEPELVAVSCPVVHRAEDHQAPAFATMGFPSQPPPYMDA